MTKYDLAYDRLLVENAKTDPEAFGAIFDAYYPTILHYVARRTADIALAEDITAEVFIKALHGITAYTWQGTPLAAWLYKIATNELRTYYRKGSYTSSLEALQEQHGFEVVDDEDFVQELIDAQTLLDRHQTFLYAQRLIAHLPAKYQEVLVLRFAENKKIPEIAQILGKREGTIKSLLSRGLQLLRKQLTSSTTQRSAHHRIIAKEGRK